MTDCPKPPVPRAVYRAACPYCHHPILWARLTHGHYRSMERSPVVSTSGYSLADVFAYHIPTAAFVALDTVRTPPTMALATHFCPQYADSRSLRGVMSLAEILASLTVEDIQGAGGRRSRRLADNPRTREDPP